MFVLLNQDVNFNDYVENGKKGQVLDVSEELAKKIISRGYGSKVEVVKLTEKEEKDLTVNEIKEILKEKGIEFDSKANKEELKALLPQE